MSIDCTTKKLRWAYLPECESLAPGWKVTKFTDVCDVIAGQSPPSNTYNEKKLGLPFLQGNGDFSEKYPKPKSWCTAPAKVAEPGDTLISVRAPVGEINRADQQYAIGRGLAAIRTTSANPDFINQAIQRWRWSLQRVAQGTTFDAVTARHFSQLLVAIPEDKDEQAAIARVLDAVDTAIERTRDALSRTRNAECVLIEDAFDRIDSKKRRLGDFATDVRYGTSQASSDRGWGNPVLRIPNVVGDQLALDDLAYVELRPADVKRLALNDGDLLLVRTNGNPNYVGRSAVFRTPDTKTWVYASYLIRVRLTDEILPEYVNIFLGSERGRRELLRRVTTSAGNHNINSNSIKLLSIPVPHDPSVQEELFRLVEASRQITALLLNKLRALENLKRSLMHDLLTGTVRIAPKFIKELSES